MLILLLSACDCDPNGRNNTECEDDDEGTCDCLAAYAGTKCDECNVDFFNMTGSCNRECFDLVLIYFTEFYLFGLFL